MKYSILILLVSASVLLSCHKTELPAVGSGKTNGMATGTSPGTPGGSGQNGLPASNSILVDASKDGGGWWYPQGPNAGGYTAEAQHQGKVLVDYLKSLGFLVDELPRGAVITTELLSKYSKVIRATAFYNYSLDELAAYETFLSKSSSLLLISDHMQNTVNDRLSERLGLMFEGSQWGPITIFQAHPITNGVSSLNFIAGSAISSWDASKITVLGFHGLPSGNEVTGNGVMGIVNNPTSKIFFIGDINGIEQVPQPFTSNVVKWLFQ